MSTSGAPGAVPQIRIRGTSTISGNVQPLWVVDGIILEDPVDANVDDLLNNRNLIASGIGGVNVDLSLIHIYKLQILFYKGIMCYWIITNLHKR